MSAMVKELYGTQYRSGSLFFMGGWLSLPAWFSFKFKECKQEIRGKEQRVIGDRNPKLSTVCLSRSPH